MQTDILVSQLPSRARDGVEIFGHLFFRSGGAIMALPRGCRSAAQIPPESKAEITPDASGGGAMQTGLYGFGRGALRWAGHAFGQVVISLTGTACLALLSNFYFNGPPTTDARAGAAQIDLSSASLAAETFAPDATTPFALHEATAPTSVHAPEPAPKTIAAANPATEAPRSTARQEPPPFDLHAAMAAAPPLHLTAMTNLPDSAPSAAIANLDSDRLTADHIAPDHNIERFTPRAVVHTVAAWGGWLTRLPSRF